MTAVKGQNRVHTRTPFFINCVAGAGGTITSATLTVKVQTGSRNASVTSMTDLATYTLSSSNVINDTIVFDIGPLVADYFEHDSTLYDITNVSYANSKQAVFINWDKTVVDTSGSTDTSGYYVGIDGYSNFTDGVNYQPVTTATGNYGSPAWSPATAKRTERTIMATDCYRQMSENSYAILPIYMGEFDQSLPAAPTQACVAFGAGEAWKTYTAGNAAQTYTYAIAASDSRLTDVRQGIAYIPIGKKNMGGNWISGYDYLRVGHLIDRADTTSGKELVTVTPAPADCTSVLSGANAQIVIENLTAETLDPSPGDTYIWTIDAFTDCSVSWPQTDVSASYQSYDGTTLTLSIPGGNQALVDCFCNTAVETGSTLADLPIVEDANDLAIINDNPVLRYEIICEPKYNVVDAFFINKWGAWDSFTFLKASRESISVSSSDYKRNIGEVLSNVYTYDSTENQRQRFNTNARKKITLNTGFVDEDFSLLLEEMLVTERMFLVVTDVQGNEAIVPVNPSTTQVDLKRHVNEKLINYTVEFEYAYDEVNTVV